MLYSVVTHAKVTKKTIDGYFIYYDLEHKEVYKPKDIPTELFSWREKENCGVPDLEEGKEYLIGGNLTYYGDGDLVISVSRCNLLRNWTDVSRAEKKLLETFKC
ncbi:hypothetical protein ANCCAN_26655 [Ancylostoma caninum]|uniref:NTR domain-containing protein n=1 Tax=Ancylostoma caninum TaxID=29170 RepID=A0A368F9K9_ANCCA|nr:hypothetical protein ANCCAN_26655 [Ancylostoma caninum]